MTTNNQDLITINDFSIDKPGLIQPHGLLLVINEPQWTICQVSENIKPWLNYEPAQLINQELNIILNSEQIDSLKNYFVGDFRKIHPLTWQINNHLFQAIIHKNQGFIFLELEPIKEVLEDNFFQFYHLTRTIVKEFQQAENLQSLFTIIAKNIRNLTNFDRVMIYRFAPDHSGCVVAEEKREKLESFLGLHYPASDVGDPARSIYQKNLIRLIPDINYTPVKLPNHPETNQPFDLSLAHLRSVHPCHIEYLQNMGVTATLTISLIHNQTLWGMIACHHYSPKYVCYNMRTLCEFLGQLMSIELINKEENENLSHQIELKNIQTLLIKSLAEAPDLISSLADNTDNIKKLVDAQGVVICIENELFVNGITPSNYQIEELIDWLENTIEKDLYLTNKLPEIYPPAQDFKDSASGILVLALTRVTRHYIIWFRPEVIQTVTWGGNPQEVIKKQENGKVIYRPRQSFEQWQETVKNTSLPWQKHEIQEAIELKTAIVGIILKKADELAALNLELQQSNSELDAFTYIASHDLKEPLRGIHNYSNFLLEDYGNILNQDGQDKLKTLVRLTKRMEELIEALLRYSRLGRTALEIQNLDLNELLEHIISMLKASFHNQILDIRIPQVLPTIQGDRILIEELLTNLITNGLKYNNQAEKWVEIGYLKSENNQNIFYVKDNGIGIREKHLDGIFRIFKRLHGQNQYGGGTGAGLTIVKRIIERHGGRIWVESNYGQGSTFYFTLNDL